jgi:hypothetical protein
MRPPRATAYASNRATSQKAPSLTTSGQSVDRMTMGSITLSLFNSSVTRVTKRSEHASERRSDEMPTVSAMTVR